MNDTTINTQDLSNLRDIFKDYVPRSLKSPECHEDIEIMVYANVKHAYNGTKVNITNVIQDIRSKSERQYVTDKKNLPAGFFSVSNFNGNKESENVTKHSGLVIIDIDKKDNISTNFLQLKKEFRYDKFVFACFTSPSGGLKVLFHTNIKSVEHHTAYYTSICNYIKAKYVSISKIDTSGSNVNRACYLPYDEYVYFNKYSFTYSLDEKQITELTKLKILGSTLHSGKSLMEVDSISFNEHFENILNLLKKRTTVGLLSYSNNENRTEVPLSDNNNNEKQTTVGLYDNIFNDFRYFNLEKGLMSSLVPFLEIIVLKNIYPNQLSWTTRLDEHYFEKNPQKQISTDFIEGLDGLEVCEIVLTKVTSIREHYRAKTLGSISMKLIFNNPFCHPDYLVKAVSRINEYYCEDPNPYGNPKPDDQEVKSIVLDNYTKFIHGELDFSKVIRKNKKNEASKKYVFRSKQYLSIDKSITQLEAIRAYNEGRTAKKLHLLEEAINKLQDGKRITHKRIAAYMGVSSKTIGRHLTENQDELIKRYNNAVKSKI